jgi:hypothetical protein
MYSSQYQSVKKKSGTGHQIFVIVEEKIWSRVTFWTNTVQRQI